MATALGLAAVVALLAFTLLAQGRPGDATVYRTDFRGPKITVDGGPHLDRAPRFRILVGRTRKTARWVQVNPVQYASCAEGNRWNGTLCSKFDLHLPAATLTARHAAAALLVAAMVAVPLAAGLPESRRRG